MSLNITVLSETDILTTRTDYDNAGGDGLNPENADRY